LQASIALGLAPRADSFEDSFTGFTPDGRALSPGTYGSMSRIPGWGFGAVMAGLAPNWQDATDGSVGMGPGIRPPAVIGVPGGKIKEKIDI
jgi:hypothetical protein